MQLPAAMDFEYDGECMKLSIVVPVYNTKPYLAECLESIAGQTFQNIEILIVDDGSTDGSDEVCKAYAEKDSRVVYIRQENTGLIGARRSGVAHASGEFLMFVDSDDWIDKGMAECLIRQIQDADVVTSGVHYENQPGMVTDYLDQYEEGEYCGLDKETLLKTMLYDADSDMLQRLTPWIWNKLYRTKIARLVYESVNTDNAFAEDGVFLYNYLIRCKTVRICHQCFYHYRYREDSMFHGGNPNMLSDINKAYLALLPGFKNHPLADSLIQQLQRWTSVTAVMAVNGGMGFAPQIHIPEFILDTDGLKGKRIVLYGAGKAGKDYFRQLARMGYNVVLWVDSRSSAEENVSYPQEILDVEYDVILISVSRPEYVDSIRQSLKRLGVGEEKLMWRQPVRTM